MRCHTESGFGDKNVDFNATGHGGRDQVSVVLAAVVTSEEDVQASNFDEEHGSTENVSGWVRCYADAGVGVSGVESDGLDHGKGTEDVLFIEELGDGFGGCLRIPSLYQLVAREPCM